MTKPLPDPTPTDEQLRIWYAAMQAGASAGRLVNQGTRFRGAMPDAETAGYTSGTPEFSLFIHGYLDELKVGYPDGVTTDGNGTVTNPRKS